MDQKGSGLLAGLMVMGFIFIIVIVYGFLSEPINETFNALHDAAPANSPEGIWDSLTQTWFIWPIILIILLIIWWIMRIYTEETELAFE